MAKCPVCTSRKGKRKCKMMESFVCSLCCGQIRKEEACLGCQYFKSEREGRKYSSVPRFIPEDMERDQTLESKSYVVEAALGAWDLSCDRSLRDESALKVLEMLMDRFHFKDGEIEGSTDELRRGFEIVESRMSGPFSEMPETTTTKIIGCIYHVARRRSRGHREYLDFIHNFVAADVERI